MVFILYYLFLLFILKLTFSCKTTDIPLGEEDFEKDFDPDEYDKKMQQLYDEDFYGHSVYLILILFYYSSFF